MHIGHLLVSSLFLLGWKLEVGMLAGEGSVDSGESLKLVGDLIWIVEGHLNELVTVDGDTGALAGDVGRVDEVGEDGLVDGGKGAGEWTDLALGGLAGLAGLLVDDLALGDKDDVLARELLLELANETNLSGEWVSMEEREDEGYLVGDRVRWMSKGGVEWDWASRWYVKTGEV